MAKFTESPILSERWFQALQFFAEAHNSQVRKDSTPYFAHLIGVAGLVLELGGSENAAIAALAHDFPEDIHPDDPDRGLEIVERRFGSEVAEIVRGCTELDKQADWQMRKLTYIEQVKTSSKSVKLVSFCDKFHNLQAYLRGAKRSAKDDSQKHPERTYWFLDTLYKEVYQFLLDAGVLRLEYRNNLTLLKQAWGLNSKLQLLQEALKEARQLKAALKQLGERLVDERWIAILDYKRQQVGDVACSIYKLDHIFIADEFAGVDCDPHDNPDAEEFRFAAVVQCEETASPIVAFHGGRNETQLTLADGSEIDADSLTVGWGKTPEQAKDNLILELAAHSLSKFCCIRLKTAIAQFSGRRRSPPMPNTNDSQGVDLCCRNILAKTHRSIWKSLCVFVDNSIFRWIHPC